MGLNSAGSLPLAVAITLVFSLGVTGVGFITAGFSRSEGEATGLGTALMVPLVFLSGAIFPLPAVILFSAFGHPVQVYDIMPSTHAAAAMTRACCCTATAWQRSRTNWSRWRCFH